jgi:hypothetical protein
MRNDRNIVIYIMFSKYIIYAVNGVKFEYLYAKI